MEITEPKGRHTLHYTLQTQTRGQWVALTRPLLKQQNVTLSSSWPLRPQTVNSRSYLSILNIDRLLKHTSIRPYIKACLCFVSRYLTRVRLRFWRAGCPLQVWPSGDGKIWHELTLTSGASLPVRLVTLVTDNDGAGVTRDTWPLGAQVWSWSSFTMIKVFDWRRRQVQEVFCE